MKRYTVIPLSAAAVVLGLVCNFAAAQENAVYKDLIEKGVPLSKGEAAKLPAFAMQDGLDEAAQEKVLADLVAKDESNPTVKQLKENRVTAPFIRVDTDIPESSGHQFDLYFIAYGKLQSVTNGNFWKARVGQQNKAGKLDFLTDEQLKQRKLTVVDSQAVKERYAFADVDLFNMVQVSGTARAVEAIGKESVVIAFLLDPKFRNDNQFPNQWRPIKLGVAGKVIGAPLPYDGVGAYAKVTELKGVPGALFVEYHIVYDEPQGWFNGKPVLRSKVGEMFRNDIRRFRNDIKDAPATAAGQAAAPAAPVGQPPAPGAVVPAAAAGKVAAPAAPGGQVAAPGAAVANQPAGGQAARPEMPPK